MLRILLFLSLSVCLTSAAERKPWAFFGYFVGDDEGSASLETSQVRDMIELKDGLNYGSAHVVIEHDRGKELNRTLKDFYQDYNYSGVMRYEIKNDGIYSLEKIGEKNMGDAQTFYEFLDWGMRTYPADRVVLTVNAHGSGILSWSGPTSIQDDKDYDDVRLVDPFVGYDATGDNLTIIEFRQVLRRIQKRYPENRISILIFDSCLSASVEAISELHEFTEIVLGSASTIPGTGMDYAAISRAIEAGLNPYEVSERVTEAFIRSVNGDNIIGAWNMAHAGEFLSALDRFSREVIKAMDEGHGKGFKGVSNYSDNYWDLKDVAKSVTSGKSDFSGIQEIQDAAEKLIQSQSKMTISVWYQGKYRNSESSGLSIFWPEKDEYKKYRGFYKKLLFSKDHAWDDFLDRWLLGIRSRSEIFNDLYRDS